MNLQMDGELWHREVRKKIRGPWARKLALHLHVQGFHPEEIDGLQLRDSQVTKAPILAVHSFPVETSLNVFLLFQTCFWTSVLIYLKLVFGRLMELILD